MDDSSSWSRYLPRSALLRDSGLSCRGVGHHVGSRPSMTVRQLSMHALLFVTSGHGQFRSSLDAATVPVVAPAVIWLFPGVAHHYDPGVDGWSEHWVLFEGTTVRAYEALHAWRRNRPVQPARVGLLEEISPIFVALREATGTPGPRAELLAATQTHALIGLAATQAVNDDAPRDSPPESVIDRLVAAALGPATVAERARAVGLSPDQLRREVAEQTSLSVHELVVRTRVARAQQLLATTDVPVSGIAHQVGYDDPAYFSRLFVARVGTSPTIFRGQSVR